MTKKPGAERSRKVPGVAKPPRVHRVRSRVRRGSLASVVRQLDELAFASYGYRPTETAALPSPALAFHFGLVGHGYEVRVFEDGKHLGTGARDFSEDHDVSELKTSLMVAISQAVEKWRRAL